MKSLARWLGRRAWEGAALGAVLGWSEIVVGYLSGGWFSARWWPVLLGYDVALGVLAGLAAGLVEAGRVRRPAAARASAFVFLAFGYAAVVANHDMLPGQDRLGPLPIVTVLLAFLLSGASAAVAGGVSLALPFLLVAGAALAGGWVPPGGTGAVGAFLLIMFTCVAAGGWVLGRAADRLRTRSAGLLGAAAVTVAACAYGLSGPRPGRADFRDFPQPPGGAGRSPRANVVLVVLDAVRADSVSAYGHGVPATPRLDALARDGVLFADALTPAPWTTPAHASLFTGLLPSRHGAGVGPDGKWMALDESALTLAEILAAEGYATAGISANQTVSSTFGLAQGFQYFESLPIRDYGFVYQPLVRRLEGRLPAALVARPLARWFPRVARRAPEVNERARRWLARPRSQPYFLFLNYMEAHAPYLADPAVVAPSPKVADEGERRRQAYQDAVRSLDEHLGRLLDEVLAQPGGDETWIVVTADHGEALGGHGLGHGCDLRPEVLHVPLIVRPPRSFAGARGAVEARPAMLTDVLPLLLDGLRLPVVGQELDGRLPGPARTFRIAEGALPPGPCGRETSDARPLTAVFDDAAGQVFVEGGGLATQLYDRRLDPGQTRNLAASRAEDVARLRAVLASWRERAFATRLAGAPRPDPERERRLRALGYLP